jgi:hypothetical protein
VYERKKEVEEEDTEGRGQDISIRKARTDHNQVTKELITEERGNEEKRLDSKTAKHQT